jgi:Acetyltransferase (GNAT) domain
MTVVFRYAEYGEYHKISEFLQAYWAKDHIYVRVPQLFEWTFRRSTLWDQESYSFALAEDQGEVVGILGGIPFEFNACGRALRAIWLANYMLRPDHRKGALAVRLLGMFRRSPYDVVVAFGITPAVIPFYRLLRWQVLEHIPRHFLALPSAEARLVHLLRLTYPDWPMHRAEAISKFFSLDDLPRTSGVSLKILPPHWNDCDWPRIASQTIGAARNVDYLSWRYQHHPCFDYSFITIPEGGRTGLIVWRLETIHHATPQGPEAVDRIGRLVEFLPVSRHNALDLFSSFVDELCHADTLGADYYGYHSQIGRWLEQLGFRRVADHADGHAIPSRFQPLEAKGGQITSAVYIPIDVPSCVVDPQCIWYWTKSDADQDRPN